MPDEPIGSVIRNSRRAESFATTSWYVGFRLRRWAAEPLLGNGLRRHFHFLERSRQKLIDRSEWIQAGS